MKLSRRHRCQGRKRANQKIPMKTQGLQQLDVSTKFPQIFRETGENQETSQCNNILPLNFT